MTKLLTFSSPMPKLYTSIEAYIAWANNIPLLNEEEEHKLTLDFYNTKNVVSAKKLVISHLKLVIKIAKQYFGYGLILADLIQEGTIGLMKAVRNFKPQIQARLSTFAKYWIKSEINEFVLKNWRIVKIATTKAQRKLFFNLRKMKQHLKCLGKEEIEKISADLKVKTSDVRTMDTRFQAYDVKFEIDEYDDKYYSPEQYLCNNSKNPAKLWESKETSQLCHENLQLALSKLDDRTYDIITNRWLNIENNKKITFKDLAIKYNISIERVRQIEKSGFVFIKKYLI